MKRGQPMRRTPLNPGTKKLRRGALLRQSEVTRQAVKPKPPPEVRLPKPTVRLRMNTMLRDSILERGGQRCDMCGDSLNPKSWECHHRRLKAQGGLDEAVNLLALHHTCHDLAHRNREWARQNGYIVHRGDDPATRPVWRHRCRWQLPTRDGWVACDAPTDVLLAADGGTNPYVYEETA